MKEKENRKISVAELFYDLIFAYAVGRISTIITTVDHLEMIPLHLLAEFAMLFLVFWSLWTYQIVYNNRFFQPRIRFYLFLFINMFIVSVLSQSIQANFQKTFVPFATCTTLLFISIAFQYFLKYLETDNFAVKSLCRYLFISLVPGIVLSLISLFIDAPLNYGIYMLSIAFVAFTPLAYGKFLTTIPTRFDHLSERYSLFMIILFGESIISMAKTIELKHLTLESMFFFVIIVLLFSFYMVVYTSGINHHMKTNGLTMIHTHLFLFWSLGLMSVLLELYIHTPLDSLFFFSLFFTSLLVFILSVLSNLKAYHKAHIVYTRKTSFINIGIIVIGGFVSFIVRKNTDWLLLVISLMLAYALYDLYMNVITRHRKKRW